MRGDECYHQQEKEILMATAAVFTIRAILLKY